MGELMLMLVAVVLMIISGWVMALIALAKISGLVNRVKKLEEKLFEQQALLREERETQMVQGERVQKPEDELVSAKQPRPQEQQPSQTAQPVVAASAIATRTSAGVHLSTEQTASATPGIKPDTCKNETQQVREYAQPMPLSPEERRPAPASVAERLKRAVRQWVTTGNVPVKVGILVLFAGVAALLKYASDEGWLVLTVQMRLGGVALLALLALGFGWIKREKNRVFALSVQGGAVGVLLLLVFAAFKLYGLMPAISAFGLTVMLVTLTGVLAIWQDAKLLAVFAILAGFLAPIWLSTGGGNHIALFSYYAVLNAGIFGMAWLRSWRMLNMLGFAFTFGIGTLWGVLQYTSDKWTSTEPFLALFFVFYLLIPMFYARRYSGDRRALVDVTLVFGTPLVAFALQAGMLYEHRYTLAANALALGVLYGLLAYGLRQAKNLRELTPAYLALAVGFTTLAVPLAFSAHQTSCIYALEGAALLWWGVRQNRRSCELSGLVLQVLAALSMSAGITQNGAGASHGMLVLNPQCLSLLALAGAGLFSAWVYLRAAGSAVDKSREGWMLIRAPLLYLWGMLWWCTAGVHEIDVFVSRLNMPAAALGFVVVSGWLAAEVFKRLRAVMLGQTSVLALALGFAMAVWQMAELGELLAYHGGLSWFLALVLGWRSIVCLRQAPEPVACAAQGLWWPLWAMVASLQIWAWNTQWALSANWCMALVALPWVVLLVLSLWFWPLYSCPLGERFAPLKEKTRAVLCMVLAVWWLGALALSGGSAPLPWLPVLNPVDLIQIGVLWLVWHWLRQTREPVSLELLPRSRQALILGMAGFALITVMTLRIVHHWGGVAWDGRLLFNTLTQASLSIVWSVLGVIGWVIGSRRSLRGVWWAGAVLMAVVLLKLVLVDRQNLGNVTGIVSFLAYGLLCVAVGYLAPAPPRGALRETGEMGADK